jgi:hypothetical protein
MVSQSDMALGRMAGFSAMWSVEAQAVSVQASKQPNR